MVLRNTGLIQTPTCKQQEFKQEGLAEAIFGLLYGEGEES